MTLADGFETLFETGFAAYIAAGSVEATYNVSGAYTALQTGIVLGDMPQAPDRCIALTAYGVSDSPALSDSVMGLQVRTRAEGHDKRKVNNLDAAIFDKLQHLCNVTLTGGVFVVQCHRNSGPASLGQDANRRWELSSNYYVTCHRPSRNRT